jgi:hypothetical protein
MIVFSKNNKPCTQMCPVSTESDAAVLMLGGGIAALIFYRDMDCIRHREEAVLQDVDFSSNLKNFRRTDG